MCRRFLACLLAAGSMLVLPGCNNDGPTGNRSEGTGSSRSTSTPGSGTRTPAAPMLVDAGTQPRTELRFRLRPGTTTTVGVTTDLVLTQELESGDRTVDPPPVTQTIRYRVGPVGPDGATVSFRVTKVAVAASGTDLTPAEVLVLTDALAPIRGIEGTGRLTPDGRFTGLDLNLPRGLDVHIARQIASLPDQLSGLNPRLPTEPVGVGATWATAETTTVAGAEVHQEVRFTVTAIDGDRVSYRATSTARADSQPLSMDGLTGNATAELVSSELTGNATGRIDLATPVGPLSSKTAGTQLVELKAAKTAPMRFRQRLEMATRVQTR